MVRPKGNEFGDGGCVVDEVCLDYVGMKLAQFSYGFAFL